jgi:hypothetical protein
MISGMLMPLILNQLQMLHIRSINRDKLLQANERDEAEVEHDEVEHDEIMINGKS